MTSKKRLKPGEARVQYHAIKPELDELLSKGHTLKGAYNILKESKNISLSYEALYRNFAGITPERAKIKRKQEVKPANSDIQNKNMEQKQNDAPPSLPQKPSSPTVLGSPQEKAFRKDEAPALDKLV